MKLSREDLLWAAAEGLLDPAQVEPLWDALSARAAAAAPTPIVEPATAKLEPARPLALGAAPVKQRFDLLHVAYYFGALIVIGAMGFFMTLGWEAFGGGGLFAIASTYAAIFVLAGRVLWRRPETRVPGGLLFTMAVCMTPLATYGLERLLGVWPGPDDAPESFRSFHAYVKSGWLWMELATVAASLVALRFVRFAFLTAPLAFVLWYMSMDLAPALLGRDLGGNERQWVSVIVGGAMLVAAYLVDRRTHEDLAFWGYLFGLLAFWGGLSAMDSDSQLNKVLYCALNVLLVVLSPLLERRVFAVFGGLGIFGYLAYLSWNVFEGSLVFPFVLSAIGIGVLAAAVLYARRRARLEAWLRAATPPWLVRLLPRSRVAGRGPAA